MQKFIELLMSDLKKYIHNLAAYIYKAFMETFRNVWFYK